MECVTVKTPVRISFFGGGTDYPAYYHRHPGAVLGTTIDQYTYVTAKKTGVQTRSDLPLRTGLGSSSSLLVGTLNALSLLEGKILSPRDLAEEACHVEHNILRENVGSQDPFHAAFGGLNIIEFTKQQIQLRPVPFKYTSLFEAHLVLFDSRVTRYASDLLKEQVQKTANADNDTYLRRMYEMVFEAEDILLRASPLEVMPLLGAKLHESWQLKKCLSTKVSNPLIDSYYQTALENGVYGGKLCGAGSGGFLAFLCPPEKQLKLQRALNLPEVRCRFTTQGSTIV